jgi:antitoxin component YwqK of YwqJK toxin-antitoxin module
MRKDITHYNKQGKAHGYWEDYYSNGNVFYKGYYHNGKRHGYWEFYNFDGFLTQKGNYDNGDRIGLWEIYVNSDLKEQIFFS